ncbi:MAG TPA: VOC family protein [Longimicrobiaceae bacterium]|nr:VOC family protein [Longimicrobiaceae bacterium]
MPSSFGLAKLGQISMRATDLPRAVGFYRDTLGIPFLFEVPRMAFFDLAGVRLMLGEPERPEHDHPGSVLYFDVPDIESAHTELRARGVSFEGEPHLIAKMPDHDLFMAFFNDSEGNLLALMSEVRKH